MPLANLHHILIFILCLWLIALWLAAFYYANPLFLMGIPILIYTYFFRNATNCDIKQGFGKYIIAIIYV
jgi:hypothetical protein